MSHYWSASRQHSQGLFLYVNIVVFSKKGIYDFLGYGYGFHLRAFTRQRILNINSPQNYWWELTWLVARLQ